MKQKDRGHWKSCFGFIYIACLLGASSCQQQEGRPPGNTGPVTSFRLTYTVPDSQAATLDGETPTENAPAESTPTGSARAGNTPIANPIESAVESLRLLFFERDDYGNGAYLGSKEAQIADQTLAGTGEVTVTLPDVGMVNGKTDYNVLVIANDRKYNLGASVTDAYCEGKTENIVRMMFQPPLPLDATAPQDNVFNVKALGGLPMSGTAVKLAGKDMSVSLLRAVARFDVKIADDKVGTLVLTSAELRNSPPVISLFSSPRDVPAKRLTLANAAEAKEDRIFGGLYATESFRTVYSPSVVMHEAVCVLVNCRRAEYQGDRTWYRVNVNVNSDNLQYLRRNNVYTVVINSITSLGAESPDEAYYGDATLLKAVTIPTDWKDAGVLPPEIDIQ